MFGRKKYVDIVIPPLSYFAQTLVLLRLKMWMAVWLREASWERKGHRRSWKNISFLTNKVADGLYAEGSEESHHEDVGDEGRIAQSHIIDEIVNVVTHLWKLKHYSAVFALE